MNIIYVKRFWSYVTIALLLAVIVYMYFNRKTCPAQMPIKSNEGYQPVLKDQRNVPPTQPVVEPMSQQEGPVDNSIGEIVLYYATWCGYSRTFLPIWEKFESYAKQNMPRLNVRKIRCEGGEERACFEKGIEGYPTVILYPKNNTEVMFSEDRTLDKLIEFATKNL